MSALINSVTLDRLRQDQKNVAILEATWHAPGDQRDAYAEFLQDHIVGARFFNLNDYYDTQTNLPNMLLTMDADAIALIQARLAALGISQQHKITLYDRSDIYSSCRAFWMLKMFGHPPEQLHILDGGYDAWKRFGCKLDTKGEKPVLPAVYQVTPALSYLRTLQQMKHNLQQPTDQVLDVRHPVRYAGGAEKKAHLRAGHIPGSFSFPYFLVFEADRTFKKLDALEKRLYALGLNFDYPIVTTCGSGMTAAIVSFVLDLLHVKHHALYDGSWSEWGFDGLYPGELSIQERPVVRSIDV